MITENIANELLSPNEVQELTGAKQLSAQIEWLKERRWRFEINRKNRIIISRCYLRLKLSGMQTSEPFSTSANQPIFENIS